MNKILSTVIIIYLLAGLVLMPKMCIGAATNSLQLCISVIIPSLFPFFVCSKMLISNGFAEIIGKPLRKIMRPVFNVPDCGAFAFIIGILSGCPVGAKVVTDLYSRNLCTKVEAQRMLCFCNNCGPVFIMGSAAAGMLGVSELGSLLYASHFVSALVVGLVMSYYKRKEKNRVKTQAHQTATSGGFTQAVAESVSLTGYVCGFVIFFGVAAAILQQSGIIETALYYIKEKTVLKGVLYGMLEMTNGVSKLGGGAVTDIVLCGASFVMGFGGLSIILQVWGIVSKYGFSLPVFVGAKFLQGVVSAVVTYVLLGYSKITLPVFVNFSEVAMGILWAYSIKIFGLFGIIVLILSILNIMGRMLRRM